MQVNLKNYNIQVNFPGIQVLRLSAVSNSYKLYENSLSLQMEHWKYAQKLYTFSWMHIHLWKQETFLGAYTIII